MRLDKWLWCARFYKTRSLAVQEIDKGRVQVNDAAAKPAREIRPGDTVALRQGSVARTVVVRALSGMRGPAPWPSCSTKKRRTACWHAARRPKRGAWRPNRPMPSATAAPPSAIGARWTMRAPRAGATAGAPRWTTIEGPGRSVNGRRRSPPSGQCLALGQEAIDQRILLRH